MIVPYKDWTLNNGTMLVLLKCPLRKSKIMEVRMTDKVVKILSTFMAITLNKYQSN